MFQAVLVTSICALSYYAFGVLKRPKNFPPGPSPLFRTICILVNALIFTWEDTQKLRTDLYSKYGGFAGSVLPFATSVFVNGWKATREALANEDCQGRPDIPLLRDRLGGENAGILFTEGESWHTQRHFVLQNFRNLGFGKKSHESLIQDEALQLVQEFNDFRGQPFVVEESLYITNINITWTVLSSSHSKHSDEDLKALAASIKDILHNNFFRNAALVLPGVRFLFPLYRRIRRAGATVQNFVKRSVIEHRATRDPENPRDFIDAYLNALDKPCRDTSFSELQLEAICMDLLLAGSDTTTSYLSFSILFLCVRKDIQDRIHQEVVAVLGTDRLPSVEQRSRFAYTEAFMLEVHRYRNVAPILVPHKATRDTTLGGYNVPRGTTIVFNMETILMDKDYWGDPETFRPERFITEDGKLRKEERLINFGKGRRSCLGESLAKMSSFLLLVILVQRLKFDFAPGFEPETTEKFQGFTLGPPKFEVIATPRNFL